MTDRVLRAVIVLTVFIMHANAASGTSLYREEEPLRVGEWSRVVKTGFGDSELEILGPLTQFQGWLYAATMHKRGVARFGAANFGIIRLTPFGGFLYAGTVNEQGAELWRSADGVQWEVVVGPDRVPANGFGNPSNRAINGLFVFQDRLYAGTDNVNGGGELWRFEPSVEPARFRSTGRAQE